MTMDPDKITANLRTKRIGRKILVYDSTSSTQMIAAEYAKNGKNDGLVVFAEEQTAGRGRAGNAWYSGRSESVLCSVVLIESRLSVESLSLTCAVAVAEAVGKPARSQAKIKWPNDIMLSGKKVAGILVEAKSVAHRGEAVPALRVAGILPAIRGRDALDTNEGNPPQADSPHRKSKIYIVGIGINCHQRKTSFPDELQPLATSMDVESHAVTDRISLAKRLLISLDDWLETAQTSTEKVTHRWRELSIQLGHRVALVFNGRTFTGHCIGVDPEKGLILQLDRGGVRMFDAAHTTIAKPGTGSF
jgi:BirA family biotin operon repressor/biotin-[acetyl-CoA-carboxylase] ligase